MCKDKGRGIGLTWSLHPFSDWLERTHGIWDFELGRSCVEMHYGIFWGHHNFCCWLSRDCARNWGRFPFNQNVGFEFSATSRSEWNGILQNFQKQGNLARYTQIFEIFFPELFFPFNFAAGKSKIFGWMAPNSEIQQFPEFLKTFPGNLCTICRRFQILERRRPWSKFYTTRYCPNLSRDLKWPFSTEFAISFLGELGLWKQQWMWLTLPR